MKPIQITLDITHEFLDNLLTTAFEGGINYWASSAIQTNSDATFDKTDVMANCWYVDSEHKFCYEFSDENDKPFAVGSEYVDPDITEPCKYRHLTIETLTDGIRQYMQKCLKDGEDICTGQSMDSSVSDSIIQYAVFGGLIFG